MISLKPLIDSWKNAIQASETDKAGFTETGDICMKFYSGSINGMWERTFRTKYLSGLPQSKFEITLNKAFEHVSIVGPTLMWGNPGRVVTTYERCEIEPSVFGAPDDPAAQQAAMEYLEEREREEGIAKTRNALMQHYLNYSHREQPGGGLKVDSQMAIIDSLVKGRGCIRVDQYQPVGTQDTLTGGFYVNVDDLYIDPDCDRPNLSNAKWMAVRHCEPHWEVERRFGLPDGSLRGKSTMVSKKGTKDAATAYKNGTFQTQSQINDLCVWFEVWSKCGVGTRFKDKPNNSLHQAFEESVGDFAYLCFVPGFDQFLNVRTEFLDNADMEQVAAAFDWPIPYYKDGRWPIAMLDYWLNPKSCWPMAPLAPGLGELVFLNVFISSLADRIFQDGLSKAAVKQELVSDAVEKLLSYQHEVIELNPSVAGNINELVTFLQRPQVNFDAFRMLEYVSMMFDKRVGLMELLYGLNPGGKVSRTAADANIKGEAVSVRPEYMSTKVEDWQTEIANLERIAAGDGVKGQTLIPLLGRHDAELWDRLITQAEPTVYLREMRSRVEANSIRKPNKAKDNQNLQQMSGYLIPVMQWYAQSTGNTEPLNEYLKSMGRAIDQDVENWLLPTVPQQGPSEEEMMAQQEAAELEKARIRADISSREMKNTKMAAEMLEMGQGLPMEMLDSIEPEETYPGLL